jgi:hypothetical protein
LTFDQNAELFALLDTAATPAHPSNTAGHSATGAAGFEILKEGRLMRAPFPEWILPPNSLARSAAHRRTVMAHRKTTVAHRRTVMVHRRTVMSDVNINTATVFELERALHNRERAQEILNKREQLGDFKDWDDLRAKVHGISDRLIRELSDSGVTVHPQPQS